MILLLALTLSLKAGAQTDSLLLVSWNLENFFDWKNDGTSRSEGDFSSFGVRHWTKKRFYAKCRAISKILLLCAQREGRIPDLLAFQEVENRGVLEKLINSTALHSLDYGIVHFDSPDKRGIDCALLYRKSSLTLVEGYPKHIYDENGAVLDTRDILLSCFSNGLNVLVNHHPSKVGGGSDGRRNMAMDRMRGLCDSLSGAGRPDCLCVGDFNDDLWQTKGKGSIKYNGAWEKIDGIFTFGSIQAQESVFDHPALLEQDKAFGGSKPRRTYSGLRYNGGISDHLPLVVRLVLPAY